METLELDSPEGGLYWSIAELAEHLSRSPRQIRTAVRSLEERELVRIGRTAIKPRGPYRGIYTDWERPIHGLIVAEKSKADAEAEHIRKLLGR